MGAGLYTYNQEQDTPRDIRKWKDTTLREYVNDCTAEDCAKGLNRMNRKLQLRHPDHL